MEASAGRAPVTTTRTRAQDSHHGVTKLLNRFAETLLVSPLENPTKTESGVVIKGRTRAETKRAMLRYWSENHPHLALREFQRRCRWSDEEVVVLPG